MIFESFEFLCSDPKRKMRIRTLILALLRTIGVAGSLDAQYSRVGNVEGIPNGVVRPPTILKSLKSTLRFAAIGRGYGLDGAATASVQEWVDIIRVVRYCRLLKSISTSNRRNRQGCVVADGSHRRPASCGCTVGYSEICHKAQVLPKNS